MSLVLLTALALIAGLALAHALRIEGFPVRILFAGTIAAAEIVAIETALGAVGFLTRPVIVSASLVVSMLVLVFSLWALGSRWRKAIAADLRSLRNVASLLRHPEIAVLSVLAGIIGLWTFLAIAHFPPRSVDDLCHHLSPIFETAVRGYHVLLPLDLRPWFAYPLNADLLFLWPTVLLSNIHWIEAAQAIAALFAAVAVAAIGRELGASSRAAMLGALLFLLLPIIPKQASSCYSDLILAAFYGAALLGAIRHARDGTSGSLLLAGMGAGLLAGTKYNYLILLMALAPLLFLGKGKVLTDRVWWKRFGLLFLLPASGLGAYWYLRNLIVLGNPVYPFRLGIGPLTFFDTALPSDSVVLRSSSYIEALFKKPSRIFELLLGDAGLGGPDGGFGPVFWGAILPIGLGYLVVATRRFLHDRDLVALAVSFQFPAAFFPYLISHTISATVNVRFLLAAAVPGIAIFVLTLERLRKARPLLGAAALIILIVTMALPLTSLAGSSNPIERKQTMVLNELAQAKREGWSGSPWRFARRSTYSIGRFSEAWEMLDFVSTFPNQHTRPLWIYATGPFPSGFYGTYLQNRLWNLDVPDRPEKPDILCFYLGGKDGKDITYFGDRIIRLEEIAIQPDKFDLVLRTSRVLVYVRRELVGPSGELRNRFASSYEDMRASDVAEARSLYPRPEEGVILVIYPVGHGLKALEFRGEIGARVIIIRQEDAVHLTSLFAERERTFAVVPRKHALWPIVGELQKTENDLVLEDVTEAIPPRSTLKDRDDSHMEIGK